MSLLIQSTVAELNQVESDFKNMVFSSKTTTELLSSLSCVESLGMSFSDDELEKLKNKNDDLSSR
jgi:hypothetical protein